MATARICVRQPVRSMATTPPRLPTFRLLSCADDSPLVFTPQPLTLVAHTPASSKQCTTPQRPRATRRRRPALDDGCARPSKRALVDVSRMTSPPRTPGKEASLAVVDRPSTSMATRQVHIDTMASIAANEDTDVTVVDCRYAFEFAGGCIKNAINISPLDDFVSALFELNDKPRTLVFHCEFSQKRGPKLAASVRNYDRLTSPAGHLVYPDIYVLEGGYKAFHTAHPLLCSGGYRPMHASPFAKDLRQCRAQSRAINGRRLDSA